MGLHAPEPKATDTIREMEPGGMSRGAWGRGGGGKGRASAQQLLCSSVCHGCTATVIYCSNTEADTARDSICNSEAGAVGCMGHEDYGEATLGSVTGSLVMPPAREIRFCLNLSLSLGNWWLSTGKLLHLKPCSLKEETSVLPLLQCKQHKAQCCYNVQCFIMVERTC